MRMKILKIVVVLLLSGSGDARPQKTEESSSLQSSKTNTEERRPSSVPETIRDDSRYTWNSGSSGIRYTNYYRDNIDPFVERNVEVSVEKSTDSNDFWESSGSQLRNPEKLIVEPPGNIDRRIANNFQERSIETNNSTTRRNKFQRQFIRGTILGDPGKNFTISPAGKLGQKLDSGYKRVPLLNPRISLLKRVTSQMNSTKTDPLRNSSNASKPFRIFNRILLNNSLSNGGASNRNPEFSGQKEGFSSPFNTMSTKVESTTPFDHVKAIKKITSMLTQKQTTSEFSPESKNNVQHIISSILPSQNYFNRHTTWKNSNGTKHRRPVFHQSSPNKKNQNKVNLNKIVHNKNTPPNPNMDLKNWPNEAIQNADDFHNYDKYTSMDDDLKQEEYVQKPFPLKNSSVTYHVPISRPNLQEIIHWFKIPPFMANASHTLDSDQANGPINIAFDPVYENLEPNKPFRPSNLPNLKPGFTYPLHYSGYNTEKNPYWLENTLSRNKTQSSSIYNPQTQVSQNTVVHLINTDSKKPNKTIIGSKVPLVTSTSGSSSTSSSSLYPSGTGPYPSSLILPQLYPSSPSTPRPGPNVHIGFTSYEQNNQVPDEQVPQTPVVTFDQSCPTILINSYTRINNTIQSKDGCTDLNIIINSHLFNTNVYKTTSSPLTILSEPENYQSYGEVDKYGSEVETAATYEPAPIYQSTYAGSSGWPQNVYHDSQKDPQSQLLQQDDLSNVEVIQDTHISISNSGIAEEFSPIESTLTEDDATALLEDSAGSSAVADPEIDSGVNSVVRPAVPPASSDTISSGVSPSPPAALAAVTSSTSRPTSTDDDDEYDLSPSGIMESIGSVFTYFTFVNPLHYGFFSLAAAPFTALAAGILGIVTFMYPWLFPSSFSFGRANNNGVDNFWSNLEEMVRQSMEKYGRVNEWKSKRKKRKR